MSGAIKKRKRLGISGIVEIGILLGVFLPHAKSGRTLRPTDPLVGN